MIPRLDATLLDMMVGSNSVYYIYKYRIYHLQANNNVLLTEKRMRVHLEINCEAVDLGVELLFQWWLIVGREAKCGQISKIAPGAKEMVTAMFTRVGDGIVSATQNDILASAHGFENE